MRKETVNLLKVIGDDREVGTHASTPRHIALVQSIRAERDIYDIFSGISLSRKVQKSAFLETIPIFNSISDPAFSRLMHFAEVLGFNDRSIGAIIKEAGVLPSYSPEQLRKRANFLVVYSESISPSFTPEELYKEKEVKKRYPWSWIDALSSVDHTDVRKYIVNQVATDQDTSSLLVRLPYLMSLHSNGLKYAESLVRELSYHLPSSKTLGLHAWINRRKK